ncbi:MAG TPA: methyltransferase domain-containing protein [Terriglobales bacterium]|nr:methyltransferase domain-containing protein [Terriglobales bacterium]
MLRRRISELLDSDSGTPDEIAASFSDLKRINRWFGGVATTCGMIEYVAKKTGARSLSLLEVGAGAGDVPQAAKQRLRRLGIDLDVCLLDRAPSHLRNRDGDSAPRVAGDARALPFGMESFDLVSSCLLAHHFPPEDLLRLVMEGLRVARTAVLINDLVWHPLHLALVYAGWPLYRSRLTQHDAPASVRQAYTLGEMREILKPTPAAAVVVRRHPWFRMGVVVWKQSLPAGAP